MSTSIGANPTDIQLNSYTSGLAGSVNNGSQVSLSSLQPSGVPILLAFINVLDTTGTSWLGSLPSVEAAVSCRVYVVLVKHNGSTYQAPNDLLEVKPYISSHGGHAAFSTIPVVIDPTGANAEAYRGGLTNPPAVRDTWSYLVDRAYLICDKWHTLSVAPAYPISFKHIQLVPDPGAFDGGNVAIAKAYVQKRIDNLNAALTILGGEAAAGSTIRSATPIRRVFFSRPVQDATVSQGRFGLDGSGVTGTPPAVNPSTATYTGDDKAENAAALKFFVALTDAGPNTVRLTIASGAAGVLDTSGGQLTGTNQLLYTPAPMFVGTAPVPGSYVNHTRVDYTLVEALQSGTVRWTRTAGAADPASPHVQQLDGPSGELGAGVHQNTQLHNPPVLVDGATYEVKFDGTDLQGNPVIGAVNANVTYRSPAPGPQPPGGLRVKP
jgi:hypothetical protein